MFCFKCKDDKPEEDFSLCIARKRGRQNQCKECVKARRIELITKIASITNIIGCQLCPENDPIVLDFHHVKDKCFDVSDGVQRLYAWVRIKKEIEKCIVLCSNCHRKFHAGSVKIDENRTCIINESELY